MQPDTKAVNETFIKPDSRLQKFSVLVVEILSWPLLLTMRLLIVGKVHYSDPASLNFKKNGSEAKYVLYANHQSQIDPFLITASLPSRTIAQLLPFRFFVNNSYLQGPRKALIYMMGGFPAYPEPNKKYGLERAKALLLSKQTVVIFPSGRRTRERIAKRGISELATELNVYLIPVYIDWKHRWRCRVHIGTPIKGGAIYSPEQLMQYVYELSE